MEVDFWSGLNLSLLAEIIGVCAGSFFVGYAAGLKLYAFRRLAHSVS